MSIQDEIGVEIIKLLKKYAGLDDKKVIITKACIKTEAQELPKIEVTCYIRSE